MGDGVQAEASGKLAENKDETPVHSVEWKEQIQRLRDEMKEVDDGGDDGPGSESTDG